MSTEFVEETWLSEHDRRRISATAKYGIASYAEHLQSRNLPVIFEFLHLATVLSLRVQVLADMVNRTEKFYREYSMPMRRGGRRKISVPSPVLLTSQRWILENILSKCDLHGSAYGFVKDRSIIDNAKMHLGCQDWLKVDLKNFFPSIKIRRVVPIFQSLGYAPNVSSYLSKLVCHHGALPQGAATSPQISNIVAKKLDARLRGLSDSLGLVYTRYADDIAVSGKDIRYNLLRTVKSIISAEGFAINEKKTVIIKVRWSWKIGQGAKVYSAG